VTDADYAKAAGKSEPKSAPSRHLNRHLQGAAQSGTLRQVIQQILAEKGLGEIYQEIEPVLLGTKAPRGCLNSIHVL